MRKGGKRGASTKTGLSYEKKVDIEQLINKKQGLKVIDGVLYYKKEKIARIFKKHKFYSFLEEYNINWKDYISYQLLPDNGIYMIVKNKLYIIECKYQQTAGSTDEKLQTCDFKKRQYQKLLSSTDIKVEYVYLLNDWYMKPRYKDVLKYIKDVGCNYYFDVDSFFVKIGLPIK